MRHDIIEYAEISSVIGRTVTVTVDRPLGSYHPEHILMFWVVTAQWYVLSNKLWVCGRHHGTGRRRAGCLHIRCG